MMQKQQLAFGMDLPPGFGCGRPMSVSEYARRRGVSHFAVQRAIKDGRLTTESVVTDFKGRPKIIDPVKADEEWEQHTQAKAGMEPKDGTDRSSLTLETIRERKWKAKLAELEYRQKSGELAPVKDMRQHYSTKAVEWRNAVLGVPSRFKQRRPHQTREDIQELNELLRETFGILADGTNGTGNDDSGGDLVGDPGDAAASDPARAVAVG
jgi:phage terminase Nu1 subunit (DNA packaging protein)